MIAIREAFRAGMLGRAHWASNISAGLIVGVVSLPLAMAFAVASGLKPEQGLYTAIIAGLSVSLFGGSRVQIAGPTGAFIVILVSIVQKHGVEGLQVATLMAGVILVLLGLCRFGVLIKFIPSSVIVGFTAGIGLIVWVSQWKDFFGLPPVVGERFYEKIWYLISVLPQLHIPTTCVAFLSLILVLLTPYIPGCKRIPGPLVALVSLTTLQALFTFPGVATIGSEFGGIPQHLPEFRLPALSLSGLETLIGPAVTIALLGAIESLLSATIADGMLHTRHHSNQELIGQGIANILTPFFGGFSATGAIARTATNVRNGGTSPLAGIVHVGTLIGIVLFCAPLAFYVPLPTLAAILFVVSWHMSAPGHVVSLIKKAPPGDVFILLVTLMLTVFVDLVVAVNVGVLLAMLNFLRRMAASVQVRRVCEEELAQELHACGLDRLPRDVLVYVVEGPFFFGAVETFEQALQFTHTNPRVLILGLRQVPFMDFTALQVLEEAIMRFHKRGINVILFGAKPRVMKKLKKAGILDLLGSDHVVDRLSDIPEMYLSHEKTPTGVVI